MVNVLIVEMFWHIKDKFELKDPKFLVFITYKIYVKVINKSVKISRKLKTALHCNMSHV